MINITRRLARLAGITGLTTMIAIGLAMPASAAAGDTSSFGVKCTGIVGCGTFAQSAFPAGPASDDLLNVSVPGIITTGLIQTTATSTGASSTVNSLNLTATAITLSATTLTSSCAISPTSGGVSGTSSIVGGTLTVLGQPVIVQGSASPNTKVDVRDPITNKVLATVVFNRQTTAGDGTLTVDAIFVDVKGVESVTVASSSCTPTGAPIPMASGTGLALGGGLLGILILGYVIRRRSVSVPQAV